MKKATEVLRHYSQPDATMRQDMRTMHGHYLTHQAKFQAFNPDFDQDFGDEWLAALDLADTTPDHTVRTGELKEDTAEVEDVMVRAQRAAQTLFYYVGRAFPNNAGRMNTYGRKTYDAARDNHEKMRTLLQNAFAAATRDHAALAAKGYSAAQLQALAALAQELTEANTDQEMKKGTNTEGRDHYVTVQNHAYGYGQEANAAANQLFVDDKATQKLFRLGEGSDAGMAPKPKPPTAG